MRRYLIRKYTDLINRKANAGNGVISVEDNERLNGRNNAFYAFLWHKLNLDWDPFFFEDWTETLWESSINRYDHLNSISGRRLNMVFIYAIAIMANYYLGLGRIVGYFYYYRYKALVGFGISIGLFLKWLYIPFMILLGIPLIKLAIWIVTIGSLAVETVWDFLVTMGNFIRDEFTNL